MKIALINSPYVDIYGPMKGAVGRYFPLGLGYLASYLIKHGFKNVTLLDPDAQHLDSQAIKNYLRQNKPDLVGISCATPNFPGAINLAKIAKEVCPKALVILGGVHASALPEWILQRYQEFDLVVIGEGELTLLEIVKKLARQQKYNSIQGIAYRRQNGKIIVNPRREWIKNLDEIPFPARHLIHQNLYRPHTYMARERQAFPLISARGCPNQCSFCAAHVSMGRAFRPFSAEYTLAEIEMLVRDYGAKQLMFHDDTFTVSPARVEKICHGLIKKGLNIPWSCFARVNTVDKNLLRLMKKAGCFSVAFGIESGNQKILNTMQKFITPRKIREALTIADKVGLKTLGFYVLGIPGETKQTIQQTSDFAILNSTTIGFFNVLTPYPGTTVFDQLKISPDDITSWEDMIAIGVNNTIRTCKLSPHELNRSVSRLNRRFYLRPSQIIRLLRQIKTRYELTSYLKGGLGLLYQNIKLLSH